MSTLSRFYLEAHPEGGLMRLLGGLFLFFWAQVAFSLTIQYPGNYGHKIAIKGPEQYLMKMIMWLNEVQKIPIGDKTFQTIAECENEILIYHDENAILGAGFTGAQKTTFDIFRPGVGADSYIRFDFRIPNTGSHRVSTGDSLIEYTAVQNVFHELVHAKHKNCGSFSRTNGEAQAIYEENIFRKQQAKILNVPFTKKRDYRTMSADVRIHFYE